MKIYLVYMLLAILFAVIHVAAQYSIDRDWSLVLGNFWIALLMYLIFFHVLFLIVALA